MRDGCGLLMCQGGRGSARGRPGVGPGSARLLHRKMLWELADGRTDSWTDSDFSLCVCAAANPAGGSVRPQRVSPAVMLFLPGWTSIKMSPRPLLLNRKEWLVSRFDPNKEREAKSEHDESEQEDEDGTKL